MLLLRLFIASQIKYIKTGTVIDRYLFCSILRHIWCFWDSGAGYWYNACGELFEFEFSLRQLGVPHDVHPQKQITGPRHSTRQKSQNHQRTHLRHLQITLHQHSPSPPRTYGHQLVQRSLPQIGPFLYHETRPIFHVKTSLPNFDDRQKIALPDLVPLRSLRSDSRKFETFAGLHQRNGSWIAHSAQHQPFCRFGL